MGEMPLSFFIAGIIQGSHSAAEAIHRQDYRPRVAAAIGRHFPRADVFDPFAHHPDSVTYDFESGRDTFFELMERAGQVDVVVAFVPEASMGTAIELWNAFHAGAVLVCVSPMKDNWVVKFLADHVVADLDDLEAFFDDGGMHRLIDRKLRFETPKAAGKKAARAPSPARKKIRTGE